MKENQRRFSLQDFLQRAFFILAARPFLAFFIGLRIKGRENLPGRFPFLLVANHTSHLDTLSLLALFPASDLWRVRPVAAADYFEVNHLVSALTRTLFNTLPIPRKGISRENDPRKILKEALLRGEGLIIFPEGTRGMHQKGMSPFKKGAAHVIQGSKDLPVVPVYLENMGRSLPKGEWIPVPFFCTVTVGRPLTLEGSIEEVTLQLAAAVQGLREGRPGV